MSANGTILAENRFQLSCRLDKRMTFTLDRATQAQAQSLLKVCQALNKGLKAHNAGEMVEALNFYENVLELEPAHPDANHNVGVVLLDIGQGSEALSFFKNALEADPEIEQYWLSYIDALNKLGMVEDAEIVLNSAKRAGAASKHLDTLELSINATKKNIAAAQPTIGPETL